jgi:hypothetical protein
MRLPRRTRTRCAAAPFAPAASAGGCRRRAGDRGQLHDEQLHGGERRVPRPQGPRVRPLPHAQRHPHPGGLRQGAPRARSATGRGLLLLGRVWHLSMKARRILPLPQRKRWRPMCDRGRSVQHGLAALCWQAVVPDLHQRSSMWPPWQAPLCSPSAGEHACIGCQDWQLACPAPVLPHMPVLGRPTLTPTYPAALESCAPGAARCACAATWPRRTCSWRRPTGSAPSGAPAPVRCPPRLLGLLPRSPHWCSAPGPAPWRRRPSWCSTQARLLGIICVAKAAECALAPGPH